MLSALEKSDRFCYIRCVNVMMIALLLCGCNEYMDYDDSPIPAYIEFDADSSEVTIENSGLIVELYNESNPQEKPIVTYGPQEDKRIFEFDWCTITSEYIRDEKRNYFGATTVISVKKNQEREPRSVRFFANMRCTKNTSFTITQKGIH